jgi:hypothetical protein
LIFKAVFNNGEILEKDYYSVGGGLGLVVEQRTN